MNQFKHLDKHFPTLPNRHFGEVVSVSVFIELTTGPVGLHDPGCGVISWKRKAWYVNASSNAFILHRQLCREFAEYLDHRQGPSYEVIVTKQQVRVAKKLLARAVWNSYVLNCTDGTQYHEWWVAIPSPNFCLSTTPSLWWNANGADPGESTGERYWRESCNKWEFPEN